MSSMLCALVFSGLAASGCVAPWDRKGTDAASSLPAEKLAYVAKVAGKSDLPNPGPWPRPLQEGSTARRPDGKAKNLSDSLVQVSHLKPATEPAAKGSSGSVESLPLLAQATPTPTVEGRKAVEAPPLKPTVEGASDLPDPLPVPSRETKPENNSAAGKAKENRKDPSGDGSDAAEFSGKLAPVIPPAAQEYPIDLTTSLRLAEVENPQIAEARQRIGEALAVLQGARVLLLPSLNIGMTYHAHTGNLQRSSGTVLNLNEKSLYFGGGADAMAAGTVEVPAISIFSSLTDAYFRPLAAHQQVEGSRYYASAMANRVLLEVAELHFELLAAEADLRVRLETAEQGAEVARLTRAYAKAGQGREADAERATTELRLVELEVRQAEQEVAVASARLAHRLHLDQSVRIRPAAPRLEEITLIDPQTPLPNLIEIALAHHPEIGAKAAMLAAAEIRHRQEIYRPLLPTLWLGYSAGAFGGGSNLVGNELSHFGGRTDFDVQVFWTLNNMGFGNLAMIKQRRAEMGEADGDRARAIAEVRAQVASAFAEVAATRRQIEVTAKQLASAEEGFREDLERIRNTVGRPIEVVNSLQLVNHARIDRIRAIIEYDKAQFRLFVALGSPPPLRGPVDTPLPPAPIAAPLLPPLAGLLPQAQPASANSFANEFKVVNRFGSHRSLLGMGATGGLPTSAGQAPECRWSSHPWHLANLAERSNQAYVLWADPSLSAFAVVPSAKPSLPFAPHLTDGTSFESLRCT